LGQTVKVRTTGGGGWVGDPSVYVDIGCGYIFIPGLLWGQVVLVWSAAEPAVTGVDHGVFEILPDMWAISIVGDGDLSITASPGVPMVAQMFKLGQAVFTTCG
jgi:hypothetical protein